MLRGHDGFTRKGWTLTDEELVRAHEGVLAGQPVHEVLGLSIRHPKVVRARELLRSVIARSG